MLPALALAAAGDVDGVVTVGVVVGVDVGVAVGVDVGVVGGVPAVGVGVAGVVDGGVVDVGVDEGLVGVGGDVEWVGVGDGDGLGWDFKFSHCCWLAPVTTDVMRADTAAEALDVPSWSAEATKE